MPHTLPTELTTGLTTALTTGLSVGRTTCGPVSVAIGVAALLVVVTGCSDSRATSGPGSTRPADRASLPATAARLSPSTQVREITFDDIKLDLAKDEAFTRDRLTPRVEELDGGRVRIRGYILPSFQQRGLTQFVLVRDNQECCFGPGAALHDCVVVRMKPGKTADFSIRPVAVTGGFRVEELRGPDGRHLAIYALDGETVQ
jgi:hypothetical protein